MATATLDLSSLAQAAETGASANPASSDDPNVYAPNPNTGDQNAAKAKLDERKKQALIQLRRTFKMRYLPKRMRFISEGMRSYEAFRGNTYALLNDQSAALDTINQLMQGFLGQGDDPSLYAHNDNIYQAFGLIFIAALMVDMGKARYQPADAMDDQDLAIARKGSIIQAFIERKNDILSKQQIELLNLWLTGSYFCYARHVVDKRKGGVTRQPQYGMQKKKVTPDGYVCPNCGTFTDDTKANVFSDSPSCPKCGTHLQQKNWYQGMELDLPVQVGEIEVANGMTEWTIVNGLMVDANPDVFELEDTEILDYTIEVSAAKVRSAYPAMYTQIQPAMDTDASSDGSAARMARSGITTPGSNNRPLTTEGMVTYSRCWIQPDAFSELEEQDLAKALLADYPDGCKLVMCGEETFLDAKPESMLAHWTWCGTVKGLGLYPPAVGKVVLDVQERVTGAVNKIEAYMDRLAFGTILYDADYIDGDAMQNKVLTPGNMTPVSRTDEETGAQTKLEDLMFQPSFHVDPEIYKYVDTLTARAQFLCGVMPQIFGGSDKNVQTAEGQSQALSTALGRLKQYLNQMKSEKANRARISVKCTIDNMDEELNIVQEGDTANSWQVTQLLKAELTGDFFCYPETDEGFPATYNEIQQRLMTLLADNQKLPFVGQLLSDPDVGAVVAHYLLPDQVELPTEPERAKIKTIIHRLAQDPNGPTAAPNPQNPQGPPLVLPSILPDFEVDDPGVIQTLSKKWLQKNWEQSGTNPKGYANVLALLKLAAQQAREAQAQALLTAQQQDAGSSAPPHGARQQ